MTDKDTIYGPGDNDYGRDKPDFSVDPKRIVELLEKQREYTKEDYIKKLDIYNELFKKLGDLHLEWSLHNKMPANYVEDVVAILAEGEYLNK